MQVHMRRDCGVSQSRRGGCVLYEGRGMCRERARESVRRVQLTVRPFYQEQGWHFLNARKIAAWIWRSFLSVLSPRRNWHGRRGRAHVWRKRKTPKSEKRDGGVHLDSLFFPPSLYIYRRHEEYGQGGYSHGSLGSAGDSDRDPGGGDGGAGGGGGLLGGGGPAGGAGRQVRAAAAARRRRQAGNPSTTFLSDRETWRRSDGEN
jgi:hypothetical protein